MQAGDRTRQGYVEHLNAFPDFCERTIRAFHEAGQRSDRSVAAMPMDFSGIKEQAEETESRLREALRTLAEVGNPEALRASAENRARHADALAQVRATKEQLERLSALLDSLESNDASANKLGSDAPAPASSRRSIAWWPPGCRICNAGSGPDRDCCWRSLFP